MQNKDQAAIIRLKLEKQHNILKNIVRSPGGREAVKLLEIKFAGNTFFQGDPYATHVRVGERRVIDYLIDLQTDEE